MNTKSEVPRHLLERLEIAAMTGELLELQWFDESTDRVYLEKVFISEIQQDKGIMYAIAKIDGGSSLKIRLDCLRNFPLPIKEHFN